MSSPSSDRIAVPTTNEEQKGRIHPLLQLPEEDLDFVLQFVLASGSLKEMAQLHGVSYPTIRASLDRVIASIRTRVNGLPPDPMTDLLASLVERGEIKVVAARNIRAVYRQALENKSAKEAIPWAGTYSKEFA